MKIFFAWIEPNQDFIPEIHCVETIRIFKCVILQRETEAAVARILTDATTDDVANLGDLTLSHALISYHDGQQAYVLFRGHVSRIPNSKGDGFMEWELNAERSDAMQQMRCLVDELKQNLSFEAGFYDSVGIAEVLENRSDIIHWDRETGHLGLSNLFVGRKTKILSDEIFHDSLVVRMGQTPLNAVHVSVEANWTQCYEDVFNLAPLIARQFKHKVISTLTIKSLIRQWPRVGDKIGRIKTRRNSGYEVVKSTLTRLGTVNGLPTVTPPIYLSEAGQEPRFRHFNYGWFKGSLWINWQYKQPCREVVNFSVLNVNARAGGGVRQLTFKLAHGDSYLAKQSATTLLRTERGTMLLNYASAVAKAHMAGSQRQLEIECCVPFDCFRDVDLDTTVIVAHSDIPGKKIAGKVVAYRLIIAPDQWFVWVKIAAPLKTVVPENASDHPYDIAVCSEFISDDYAKSPSSDWALHRSDEIDHEAPDDPETFRIHDLVESIRVGGDSATQVDALMAAQYPTHNDYKAVLRDHLCFLNVQFRSLEPKPVIETTWERGTPIMYQLP